MKSLLLILVFILVLGFLQGQNSKAAIKYYDAAVKYFNNKEYKIADSLFTLSNNLEPHKDTYFSRSVCRLHLGNKKGYCEDLAFATHLGDGEAHKLYWKYCGTADTVYLNKNDSVCKNEGHFYKQITYKSEYTNTNQVIKFDKNNFPVPIINDSDTISSDLETIAEFPGGIPALMNYLTANIKYPKMAIEANISGKVFLKFVVFKDGTIRDVTVLKGVSGCIECDNEAIRVVNNITPWKPSKVKGKNVSCYFNLPITFKIYNPKEKH